MCAVLLTAAGIKRLMVVIEMARQEAARKGSTQIDSDCMFNCAAAIGLV
jgi:hypothetical protein